MQAAHDALEKAQSLPDPERRRLMAEVLAAAARDAERRRQRVRARDSLGSLASSLREAHAELRRAASEVEASLARMIDLRHRLRGPRR